MLSFQRLSLKVVKQGQIRRVSTTAAGGTKDPHVYCRELVHKHDYPSFLCGEFFPKSQQPGYFALKAFFVELSTVPEAVSNHAMGKMRFQFWRDAISAMTENRPPRHPIVLALHEAGKTAKLQPYHLKRIIDAREAELTNPVHMTIDSMTAHAESTYSTLLYLLLSLLQDSGDSTATLETISHIASHLGIAQCFAVLLRAIPFHASRGHLVIPADIAAKHGLRQEEFLRRMQVGRPDSVPGLADAVFDIAVNANDQLLTAKSLFEKELPGGPKQRTIPVFLQGITASRYLGKLQKVNFDAWHPQLQRKDWLLPWHIWRNYYKQRFW